MALEALAIIEYDAEKDTERHSVDELDVDGIEMSTHNEDKELQLVSVKDNLRIQREEWQDTDPLPKMAKKSGRLL